ncbi:MAG: hypothetical protein HFH39_08490 [Lachnospiraceae bacterium]|jgi:hypothetical protein|nr:hypothetical protein [Lachnospiraceae bacterium]
MRQRSGALASEGAVPAEGKEGQQPNEQMEIAARGDRQLIGEEGQQEAESRV